MASLSFYTACCALLAASASARHLHRPQVHHHEHQRRQIVTPTSALTSEQVSTTTANIPVASITAGNDAIADIQQIQQGLSDLPANLLSFVQAVEARLEDMERMLIELMGSPVASASPTPAIQPPSKPNPPSPTSPFSSTIFPSTTPSLASTTFETTYQTSRFTSTRARTTTVPLATTSAPVSVSNTASQGLPSGLIPLASGNWTLPFATSGRPAVAPSTVRTAGSAAPAPTAWTE